MNYYYSFISPEIFESLVTAVVGGSVSAATLLSIICCLIGALLHHILISSPCWASKKTSKKKQTTTEKTQDPLYDEIALAEGDGNPQTASVLNEETIHNKAYAGVQEATV